MTAIKSCTMTRLGAAPTLAELSGSESRFCEQLGQLEEGCTRGSCLLGWFGSTGTPGPFGSCLHSWEELTLCDCRRWELGHWLVLVESRV